MTEATPHRYTAELANTIEQKWQAYWRDNQTFYAPNPVGDLATGAELPADKLNVQDMFPYPSGAGLHVGHPLSYIATDVYARYNRMLGKNVLHTLGYDAFGLPAEQYAVQTGTHPRTTTEANIERYLGQIRRLGLGHRAPCHQPPADHRVDAAEDDHGNGEPRLVQRWLIAKAAPQLHRRTPR